MPPWLNQVEKKIEDNILLFTIKSLTLSRGSSEIHNNEVNSLKKYCFDWMIFLSPLGRSVMLDSNAATEGHLESLRAYPCFFPLNPSLVSSEQSQGSLEESSKHVVKLFQRKRLYLPTLIFVLCR